MASPAVQRAVARALLSLPPPLLRLMAGGGVVYRAGRTLDPRFQFLAVGAKGRPPIESLTPEEARRAEASAISAVTARPEPGVRWEGLAIAGPGGDIPARAYRPENQDPESPLMVWAHMGGGVIGGLETSHAFCTLLAKIARCAVLSVDYRLAPEHRFPAGLEDVLAAYRWGRDHANELFAPRGRAAIGGDSMGGTFAAIVAQEMKRGGEPQPALQLLVYPLTDVASQTPSMTLFADAFPLNKPAMDYFMGHYMGPRDDPADPRLSPLKAGDLSGLAPAVVVTAGFDPLVDQGEAYARALKAAGVPVAYRRYDALAHAFTAFGGAVPAADAACREIAGLVRDAFQGGLG
jgi:acetyl esterase